MARKKSANSYEHALFGDEDAAAIRSELSELRSVLSELNVQVQSQFTTIAAHAEIARQQADFIRDEAQANLDRTRETLIGLLEQVRRESGEVEFGPDRGGTRAPWSPPGPSAMLTAERVGAVEMQLASALDTVQLCFQRQQDLAATMEALLDTVVFESRNEPVLRLA
jgi:ElaB/YqjD/DUF883 family membrane-anchored ribosome-binding protein